MKKLSLSIFVIIALLFVGCATSGPNIIFDPSIPEDQMSYLLIDNFLDVSRFDNAAVDWEVSLLGVEMSIVTVGIPAGQHSIVFSTEGSTLIPKTSNETLTLNFEAGKKYRIMYSQSQGRWGLVEKN